MGEGSVNQENEDEVKYLDLTDVADEPATYESQRPPLRWQDRIWIVVILLVSICCLAAVVLGFRDLGFLLARALS
jgi:hypothetical protein